jgi:hypothetical protein
MQDQELCTEMGESADGARNEKAGLVYGLLLYDDPHAVESEHAHKLALRDLRTAVPDGRRPGASAGPSPLSCVRKCGPRTTRRLAALRII